MTNFDISVVGDLCDLGTPMSPYGDLNHSEHIRLSKSAGIILASFSAGKVPHCQHTIYFSLL